MITQQQYYKICDKGLGLRVNADTDPDSMKAASYSMCITKNPMDSIKGEPAGWEELLTGTITTIMGFDDSAGRYLCIVSPSRSDNFEYQGCFPKSSSKPTAIHASIQITPKHTIADLCKWVASTI